MANPYAMNVNDSAKAPKQKDSGNAESGLSMLSKISTKEQPMSEQARFSSGERNESLPGGFKLTQ